MLTVDEAQTKLREHIGPLLPQRLRLSAGVLGLVLAEDVSADLDMPPYDKAMMDGYAVRCEDLESGSATLRVIEEVTAGQTPRSTLKAGEATRIMTGAPIPAGAEAVIPVERTRALRNAMVQIDDKPVPIGHNILRRGREMCAGDVVLKKGARLRPQELGLLATVGRTEALLHPAPRIAVLSTGDEVVEASQLPGPGQIRNGNGPMLMAQVATVGAVPRYLGLAQDTSESLKPLVREGITADILILSGGVSAGKLDLVPGVLGDLGVKAIFHKVAMKPGKPVFFGTHPHGFVFGLPGNPVSALVCFELFVRPAIRILMGLESGPHIVRATLAEDFAYRTDRPTYHPAKITIDNGILKVTPVAWFGSPDLRGVTAANAFAVIPAGNQAYRAGERLDVLAPDMEGRF